MAKIIHIDENELRDIICECVRGILETSACLGGQYYNGIRHLCHDVKAGDIEAIDDAGIIMSKYVPPRSVLIPIPQHSGKAEYTLKLANRIAKITNATVLNIQSSIPRQNTLYVDKRKGKNATKINLGLQAAYSEEFAAKIKSARNVILIDNVIDSGTTYEQAKKAVMDVYGVEPWLLTLGAIENPKNKSLDVIRSIYPSSRLYEDVECSKFH